MWGAFNQLLDRLGSRLSLAINLDFGDRGERCPNLCTCVAVQRVAALAGGRLLVWGTRICRKLLDRRYDFAPSDNREGAQAILCSKRSD
jgi:hypothetical protein